MTFVRTTVRLKARPSGLPGPEHWDIRQEPVAPLASGEALVAVRYISVSPSLRAQMDAGGAYLPPVAIGDVVRARGVGVVVESRAPGFAPGDTVEGPLGSQSHYAGPTEGLTRVDPAVPLTRYLGVLGMTGFTAYFGMLDVARPKPGETVLVSAAAGAVGGVAGQIARLQGCRVIGVAGGPDKCAHAVRDLGFDACIDHRRDDIAGRLAELAPDGIDVYFDNVGGPTLEAALLGLRHRGRIAICGFVADYNDIQGLSGARNYLKLLETRSRMEGFSVYDFAARFPEARTALAAWLASGAITASEHVEEGLERFPEVLRLLFGGAQVGKLVLKV
ncbi:NADP-dependent oxidoreductase [Phenylobacterium sp.]|uniref:NADP-dependent oxidoreductase n=1 Tax=Phenylobacterium sp. TaxID=1871053 RepID=UPI0025E13F85|nr:NADP-dependent oxidoreductase [Phenylobacterium sp.]MBX3484851.1 NADP-dependent oxidoreductase [Phenylobacterium sp.]MCW5761241.1 NADP-dependent oxidoreductase [Phenylobacterium sp.]